MTPESSPIEALRSATIGLRLRWRWPAQKHQLPGLQQLARLKARIQRWWKSSTLPSPEPGLRLLPCIEVAAAREQLAAFRTQLLDRADTLEWSFVSLDPPACLAQLAPQVFAEECQKFQAILEESLTRTRKAFLHRFQTVVAALRTRLTPETDGQKKVLRARALENLTAFLSRFQKLDLPGQQDLAALVAQAGTLLAGIDLCDLRTLKTLREEVHQGLGTILSQLETLQHVDAPG
jgi:hypothetical protein